MPTARKKLALPADFTAHNLRSSFVSLARRAGADVRLVQRYIGHAAGGGDVIGLFYDSVTAADMAYRDACVSHTKNGIYGEIFSVPVVDTTAAGDTFLGFFFAMLERFGAERALKIASAASAVAVSRPGASASIPTLDEVKKFLEERGESLL